MLIRRISNHSICNRNEKKQGGKENKEIRKMWHSKSSMKKMPIYLEYDK